MADDINASFSVDEPVPSDKGSPETSSITPENPPLERAADARLQGYSWPEINGHVANLRATADQYGYSPAEVDAHMGYTDKTPLEHDLALGARANRSEQTTGEAEPLSQASGGLFKQTDKGIIANEVDGDTRQSYADAITNGQVKGPQDFAESATDAISRAAGVDASGGVMPLASQLPSPSEAIDYAIGVTEITHPNSDYSTVFNTVNDTRTNLLNAWAQTGEDLNTLYRGAHSDPLFQDAVTSPITEPQSGFSRYLQESGEALGDMAKGAPDAVKSLLQDITSTATQGLKVMNPANIPALDAADEAIKKMLGGAQPTEGALQALMLFSTGGFAYHGMPALKEPAEASLIDGTAPGGYQIAPIAKALLAQASPYAKVLSDTLKDTSGELKPEEANPRAVMGDNMPPEAINDLNAAAARLSEGVLGEKPPTLPPPTDWTATRGPKGFAFSNLEDELNRLRTNNAADKKELLTIVNTLPEDWRKESFQNKISTEVEHRMVDPNYEHQEDVANFLRTIKPLTDEQYRLGQSVDKLLNGKAEDYDPTLRIKSVDDGYVHRLVSESSLEAGGEKANPITGSKSLSRYASGMQKRSDSFSVWDDGNGNRNWNSGPNKYKLGDTDVGPDGITRTLKPATMQEIETNTANGPEPIKYDKNFVTNTVENVARLKQVERNLNFLNTAGKDLEDSKLLVKDTPGQLNARPEPGWVRTNVPQLEGWADPKVAHPLNDFFDNPTGDLLNSMRTASNFLIKSLYLTPYFHDLNMTTQWTFNRGLDWVKPSGYGSMIRNMMDAHKEIMNGGPRWIQHVREGSASPYMEMQTRNFTNVLHDSVIQDLSQQPEVMEGYAKRFGVAISDVYNSMLDHQSASMWHYGEVLKLGRQFELEEKGMPTREAIFQAEKDINNYRVPSQALGSHAVHEFLTDSALGLFGRYHFGLLRSQALMVDEMMRGSTGGTGTRAEALGKALVMSAGALVVLPLLSYGISKGLTAAWQNPDTFGPAISQGMQALGAGPNAPDVNVHLGSPGALALYHHVDQIRSSFTEGQSSWMAGVGGLMSLSPVVTAAMQALWNETPWGTPVRNPLSSGPGQAGETVDAIAKSLPLGQWGIELAQGKWAKVLGEMVALKPFKPGENAFGYPGQVLKRNLENPPDILQPPAGEQPASPWDKIEQGKANTQERNSTFGSIFDWMAGTPPPAPAGKGKRSGRRG